MTGNIRLSNFSRVAVVRMTAARLAWKSGEGGGLDPKTHGGGEAGIRCKYSRETLGWLWPSRAAFVRVAAAGIDSCLEGGFFSSTGHHARSQTWRRSSGRKTCFRTTSGRRDAKTYPRFSLPLSGMETREKSFFCFFFTIHS